MSLGDTSFLLNEGITIGGKTMREHNEIIGHSKAIDVLYEIIKKDFRMTQTELFELHKCVMIKPPMDIYAPVGKYKVEENYTNRINSKGQIETIEYPSFTKTNDLMNKWFKLFDDIKDDSLEMQYAKLHCAFVKIHPFADGNGRMARLIANIPILKQGFPPVTIDNNNSKSYIELLQEITIDDELNITKIKEFSDFIKEEWIESIDIFNKAYKLNKGI